MNTNINIIVQEKSIHPVFQQRLADGIYSFELVMATNTLETSAVGVCVVNINTGKTLFETIGHIKLSNQFMDGISKLSMDCATEIEKTFFS